MEDIFNLDKQLCFSIYDAGNQFNKLYSKVLHSFGLTYPQYLTLLALWEKDGLTVKEIGERLNLGSGTLTPMIKRMEANGWVKKERSTVDERRVSVFLQPKAITEKSSIIEKIKVEVNTCNIEFEEYEQLMIRLHLLQKKLRMKNESLSNIKGS
ncbi:MarR family transcriptional regulator [Bacillus sp. BGMRC 2118]|nr:MarR family transcriptional regulator [Bacillus sp. BGMRC 2118]